MTHWHQYAADEGRFSDWKPHPERCRKPLRDTSGRIVLCGQPVRYRVWESWDGLYEDEHYTCDSGHTWWIDGLDA